MSESRRSLSGFIANLFGAMGRGLIIVMKLELRLLGIAALVLASLSSANADLIGVTPGFPLVQFENLTQSAVNYDPATQAFNFSASPGAIAFTATDPGTLVDLLKSLTINITVDHTGALVTGDHGFDLQGTLNGAPGLSGTLLTGNVMRFGWSVYSTPGAGTSTYNYSDNIGYYDFDILVTGGALKDYFPGSHVGMFAYGGTTSTGDFTTGFTGYNVGIAGALATPEPTTWVLLTMGLVCCVPFYRRCFR